MFYWAGMEFNLADADLMALAHERRFAPRIVSIASDLPRLRHFLCLEDDSGADASALGAVDHEPALAEASPERDFGPRSPDDLSVLYTGGTTGVPKGTLWRQEDIFFAALGGGNFGGEPIERPEQIAGNAQREPVSTLMAIAPTMHGGGQWVAFNAFFAAGRRLRDGLQRDRARRGRGPGGSALHAERRDPRARRRRAALGGSGGVGRLARRGHIPPGYYKDPGKPDYRWAKKEMSRGDDD